MATENAQRITRETAYGSPAVTRFEQQQSLKARVGRGRVAPQAANDNVSAFSREAANDIFFQGEQSGGAGGNILKRAALKKANPLRWTALGMELWIAGICASFQFVFGFTALVFFTAGQYDLFFGVSGDDVANFLSTWVGGAALAGANFVGFFFGFHVDVPPATFTEIGLASWGIALVFTVLGYLSIAFVLHFEKINVFESTEMFLLTIFVVALDLMFVTQLFPWMFLWILAIHMTAALDGDS